MAELAAHLHALGVEVSVSAPAKTVGNPGNYGNGAWDYRRLGEAVDRVLLMTYDEHDYSRWPGPIASSGWVEAVVAHAVSLIPA